jgi:hypothetical protein
MVPEWDQRCRYASKAHLSVHCMLAIERLLKPCIGQVMVLSGGYYIGQITRIEGVYEKVVGNQATRPYWCSQKSS